MLRVKKIILSSGVVLVFAVYAFSQKPKGETATVTPSNNTVQNRLSTSIPTNNTTYKDGNYTGPVTDAFYGPFQVRAVILGGKITDIIFLKYPNDRSESVQINSEAITYLKSEAITVQSANVDIVTGATQSSEAFRQSLSVALSQAR